MTRIVPVVLSGGSGTRLWPLSREAYPKQLLPLLNDATMLQDTLLRLDGVETAPAIIICNDAHRFLVAEQLREKGLEASEIILEPCGRNTAPAIAVAACAQADPEDILLVLPADHVILDVDKFHQHVREGAALAAAGHMVTFGIVPTAPETGYGYIHTGAPVDDLAFEVQEFVEKPDAETAAQYLAGGKHYWNSGMFMFAAGRYLEELAAQQPLMRQQSELAYREAKKDLDFVRLDAEAFAACPSDSIDYAVMEHTRRATVIPADIGWSDVGSWSSLWEVSDKDANGNRFSGDVLAEASKDNFVHAEDRLVSLVGVENMVIVDTADALLVASKDRVQEVKTIVARLKAEDRPETQNHRLVYRPWGSYDSVDEEQGFQVKRITVNPGASLSLQMHHHRAEHWIVVSGTAEVTCGEKVFLVEKNQSTYIPLGEQHRLRNPGKIPLKLIEVQSGDYLGEDDIVRFEDNYGRE